MRFVWFTLLFLFHREVREIFLFLWGMFLVELAKVIWFPEAW
jgi:hypothetical protein